MRLAPSIVCEVTIHMRRSTRAVGVVPAAGSPVAAVVDGPVPARGRRYAGFPWDSKVGPDLPVPFEARTYTFSWVDGAFAVLPQAWEIDTDAKNRVVGYAAGDIEGANKLDFPELTYKQAKAIQDLSSKEGVSLKVAFARLVDLSDFPQSVIQKIALAPERYARPSQEAAAELSRKAIEAEFWKQVKGGKKEVASDDAESEAHVS